MHHVPNNLKFVPIRVRMLVTHSLNIPPLREFYYNKKKEDCSNKNYHFVSINIVLINWHIDHDLDWMYLGIKLQNF